MDQRDTNKHANRNGELPVIKSIFLEKAVRLFLVCGRVVLCVDMGFQQEDFFEDGIEIWLPSTNSNSSFFSALSSSMAKILSRSARIAAWLAVSVFLIYAISSPISLLANVEKAETLDTTGATERLVSFWTPSMLNLRIAIFN